jgi:RNA polymerase sigma factor (sigma-70 family)
MYQNIYEQVLKQFCKFCTRVLKNEVCNIFREQNRRQKYETELSTFENTSQLCANDEYFLDKHIFEICGIKVSVSDSDLADAVCKLPEDKRNIILLSYFAGLSDVEISRRFNTIPQTIFARRKRSLKLLQSILGKGDF